jgi:hypothetical protein
MLALAALLVSPLVGATTYPLLESWSGSNFLYVRRGVGIATTRRDDVMTRRRDGD